jgi:hypothetical protein
MPFMINNVFFFFSISIPSFKVEGINQMIASMQHILTLVKESMQSVQNQTKHCPKIKRHVSKCDEMFSKKVFLK